MLAILPNPLHFKSNKSFFFKKPCQNNHNFLTSCHLKGSQKPSLVLTDAVDIWTKFCSQLQQVTVPYSKVPDIKIHSSTFCWISRRICHTSRRCPRREQPAPLPACRLTSL